MQMHKNSQLTAVSDKNEVTKQNRYELPDSSTFQPPRNTILYNVNFRYSSNCLIVVFKRPPIVTALIKATIECCAKN